MCSLLVRSEVLKQIGGFEESFRGFFEDQAFLTKVYLTEKVFVSSGCFDRYRIHSKSCCASVNNTEQRDSYRKQFMQWFKQHLQTSGVTDTAVWKALNDATQACERPLKTVAVIGFSESLKETWLA